MHKCIKVDWRPKSISYLVKGIGKACAGHDKSMLDFSLEMTTRPWVFSTNFGLLLPIGSTQLNTRKNYQKSWRGSLICISIPIDWNWKSLCWTTKRETCFNNRMLTKTISIEQKLRSSAPNWFWKQNMPNLNSGTGAPWAGHLSLSLASTGWVVLVRSVSDGNLGAEPPTGSEYKPEMGIISILTSTYLNAGLGDPCAGQVISALDPTVFETRERSDWPENLGAEWPTGSDD